MSNERIPRRSILKSVLAGLAVIPAGAIISEAQAGAPPALVPLDPADATGKALGYSPDTTKVDAKAAPTHKPEQKCATCVQFQGKAGDARGGCNLFPGKSVASGGWCKVWALKPGAPAA
jgi:hypothetical protein